MDEIQSEVLVGEDHDGVKRLVAILKFRNHLHEFFATYAELNSYCLRHFLSNQLKEIDYEEAINTAASQLKSLLSLANQVMDTLTELKPALGMDGDTSEIDGAFSITLVRLSQANPLRFIPFRSPADACDHLNGIFTEIIHMGQIMLKCLKDFKSISYEYLLHFVIDCAKKHHHLLSRSLLASLLHIFRPIAPNFIRVSMHTRGVPSSIIASPATSTWTESSLSFVAWETLKGFCVHYNTIIIKLDALLSKWGFLSREAHMVDQTFQTEHKMDGFQCHVYWTMIITSLLMDATLANMFECELISLSEFDYYFW